MAKTRIGITQGDSNGIGYEVIIKALADSRLLEICTPVVYGCSRTFNFYRKGISDTEQMSLNIINNAKDCHSKRINFINCVPETLAVEPGQPTADAAKAAVISLEAAVADLLACNLDAIVTAPVNKHTLSDAGFEYTGHTEYLISKCACKDGLMFLCSENLKVGVVTNHLPISQVGKAVTTEAISAKIRIMDESLRKDFAIGRPKIAVLGLNPHAGDAGTLGSEEQNIILPAINRARQEGILAYGPYSPDGFFANGGQGRFDAVLAMYHDQGLIPFKALSFDDGVNFTAGLPVVRTSPDHGTAYEIAGKNCADSSSMLHAILGAVDICRNRQQFALLRENPLDAKRFETQGQDRRFEKMFEKDFDKSFKSVDGNE